MDFEAQRDAHIKYKAQLLADLKLESRLIKPTEVDASNEQPTKKRKLRFESRPSRVSARIASSNRPSYIDEAQKSNFVAQAKSRRRTAKQLKTLDAKNDVQTLIPSADARQIRAAWTNWEVTAKAPTRDDQGTFHFANFPLFTPNKSPEEVLREGCFGGSYFRPLKSRRLGILIENDWQELPSSWSHGLDVETFMTGSAYRPDVNKFKAACGQSIEEWEANGWIAFEFDIRGWFQWYCRFFQGRRCNDDERQVSRWRKCVGANGRWRSMLLKKYLQMGVKEVFDDGEDDKEVSPVMHQTCHHWAYEVKQHDLDAAWKKS